MITILLQKILEALTQLLFNLKTKLNTIKDNLDNLIVVATASGPIASFTTTITKPFISLIVDVPESESGTDTVIVTQTGKNLFNPSISSNINTSINAWGSNDTNIVAFLNTLKQGTYKLSYKIKVDAINGSGTDSYGIIIAPSSGAHINTRATESNVSVGSIFERNAIITIGEGTTFTNVWFYTGRSPATSADSCTFYDFQLEVGNQATAYEPYSATTKTVSLPSTVYGGEVDITDSILPEIKAKNGVNNIFTDSGDVTVAYLKLYKED